MHFSLDRNLKSFLAAAFYGNVSLLMDFVSKVVLTSFGFNFPYIIMTVEVFVCNLMVLTSVTINRVKTESAVPSIKVDPNKFGSL